MKVGNINKVSVKEDILQHLRNWQTSVKNLVLDVDEFFQ